MSLNERKRRLLDIYNDLGIRLQSEMEAINMKRYELAAIEQKLSMLGWPGITIGAYIGSMFFPGKEAEKFREDIDRLLQRREQLIQEIMRERTIVSEIANRRKIIAMEIEKMARMEAEAIRRAQREQQRIMMERARQSEIQRLIGELAMARAVGDEKKVMEIMRRLRELGYL